jgi:hypothetical protein
VIDRRVLFTLTINGATPIHPNIRTFGHCLDEGAKLVKFYDIITFQLHFVPFFRYKIRRTASNIEANCHNIFVGANGIEELRVGWDHSHEVVVVEYGTNIL